MNGSVTLQAVEDMRQGIHDAYAIAMLMTKVDKEIDEDTALQLGELLKRQLSMPMETTGDILSEKRESAS